jgi:hypothetical protein
MKVFLGDTGVVFNHLVFSLPPFSAVKAHFSQARRSKARFRFWSIFVSSFQRRWFKSA